MNDAERAAEEILQEAYPEARAEACPQGEECGVHFRKDEEFSDVDFLWVRLITYVGESVVVTGDNPEAVSPGMLAEAIMTTLSGGKFDLPKRWETEVFHVGDGVLADIDTLEKVTAARRYSFTHDEWDQVHAQHSTTITLLNAGMIDASKPLEG